MNIIFQKKTKHNDIIIVEKDNNRILRFKCSDKDNSNLDQSGISLSEPYFHVFDYTFLSMYSFIFVNNPSKILIIGLGGGVMPKEISRYFPKVEIDIIEIDEEMPQIASKYFNFNPSQYTKIHIGDAYNVIQSLDTKYDIIIVDAFDNNYIPKNIQKMVFIKNIHFSLKDNGVVAWNTFPLDNTYKDHINNIFGIFEYIYLLRGIRNNFSYMFFTLKNNIIPLVDSMLFSYPKFKPIRIENKLYNTNN